MRNCGTPRKPAPCGSLGLFRLFAQLRSSPKLTHGAGKASGLTRACKISQVLQSCLQPPPFQAVGVGARSVRGACQSSAGWNALGRHAGCASLVVKITVILLGALLKWGSQSSGRYRIAEYDSPLSIWPGPSDKNFSNTDGWSILSALKCVRRRPESSGLLACFLGAT